MAILFCISTYNFWEIQFLFDLSSIDHVSLWTSLEAQTVKNLPAMQIDLGSILCWEDFLEKGMATHSSILAWRIPTDRGTWQATVYGVAKSQA